MSRHQLGKGALLIVVSELAFAGAGAAVKAASDGLPVEMIVFFRNLVGLALLVPIIVSRGIPRALATAVPHLHLLRATVGVGGMYCFFYALGSLPLADGVLLKMTAPFFVPLLAWAWLREALDPLALLALPVGFVGVALIIDPGGELQWIALVGLAGGMLAAAAKVTVRRLTETEPAVRIVFYFAVLAALISAVPALLSWREPTTSQWLLLLAVGGFATGGQLLLTRGYAAAPASRVGPFTYTAVIFGALFGYLFWGETLDALFFVGGALIMAAGVLAVVRNPRPITASVDLARQPQ